MARKLPTLEELHTQALEAKASVKIASKHVITASEGLSQLLADYNPKEDNAE